MKTADIVVGEEYGWESWKGAPKHRVKVLRTGLPQRQGYGYAAKTVKSGVEIQYTDQENDQTRIVPARQIVGPWVPIQAALDDKASMIQEARKHSREVRRERAAQVAAVSSLLADAGAVDGLVASRVYEDRYGYTSAEVVARQAAQDGLFVILSEEYGFGQPYLVVPRESLADFATRRSDLIALPYSDIVALANLGYEDPECECHRDDS